MSVVVRLDPATVAIVPGETATIAVRIRNSSKVVDEFSLGVVGDAHGWSAVDPAVLSLFPGAEGDATIMFTPPRLSSVPAGSMPFGLRVQSKEDPAGSIVEEGSLDIAPFREVSAELVPRTSRGSAGATHDVAVDNRGNVAFEAALTALDADRLLAFDMRPPAVVADPGAAVFAKVRVQPRRRFWRGAPVARPFQLQVTVADTPPVTLDGTLLQTPILPSWTVRALVIALALIVAAVVLWLTVLRPAIESTARSEAVDVLAEAGISPLPSGGATPVASGGEASPPGSSGSPTASGSTEPTATPSMSPPAGGSTLSDGRLVPGGTPFTAPAGTTLYVTDLVFSNPGTLTGPIQLDRAGKPLLVLQLENFRDLDFHFSTPIAVRPGETLALVCPGTCDGAAIYYSGFRTVRAMNPALIARFAVSALVGVSIAIGAAAVTSTPQLVSTADDGPLVPLTDETGNALAVELKPAQPAPLEPPPATATVTLTTFHAPAPSAKPGGTAEAGWLKQSVPRVPAITQFDGGPLQSVNCLMASGAMLARLGYGIRTTGSQLRALQDDQAGGTNHTNLQNALRKGWNVQFRSGALTPLQLRALLYAGGGAVVGGIYGELPMSIRLQKDFTGSHSVYIDAFRPPGPDGPAAYYVMDPIGRTWRGYRGSWWPADVVERFATALLGGKIYTMWTFPGGVAPPIDHPILPPDAYPGAGEGTPSGEPIPSASAPGASPSSSPIVGPIVDPILDPLLRGDLPIVGDPTVGDPPDEEPQFPDFRFETNLFELIEPDRRTCLGRPQPAGCPQGIMGIVDLRDRTAALPAGSAATPIEIRYAGAIAPDTYEVIFVPPPDTSGSMWFWSRAGGALIPASIETGVLDGQTIAIATVTLEPGVDYSFVAAATGDGVRTLSTVGGLSVEADQ